jgi:hypothetical protein
MSCSSNLNRLVGSCISTFVSRTKSLVADVEPGETFRCAVPRPLLRLPHGFLDADISPDGQQIAVCVPTGQQGRSAINLVMNWDQELEDAR